MLERLAEDPGRLTASGLWKALRPDERARAAQYYLEDGKRGGRKALVTMVALTKRARPETVRKWPDAKLAGGMKTAFSLEAKLASSLLERLHRTGRRAMLGRFVDLLGAGSRESTGSRDRTGSRDGAGSRNGPPDSVDTITADEGEVHAAADQLVAEYGVRNVVVYFLVLALRRASVADHLWSWMRRLGNGAAPLDVQDRAVGPGGDAGEAPDETPPEAAAQTAVQTATQTASDAAPAAAAQNDAARARGAANGAKARPGTAPEPASLTVLDRVLLQTILDTVKGVAGSLSKAEVDAAVSEFVSLNGRRPTSYYHAGFRDALFGRAPKTEWPALGREGTRHYWAGAIRGWARSKEWPKIVREYDGGGVVRELGDGTDFASAEALEPTVRALADDGRTAELARFVQMPALADRLGLYRFLLDAAVRRLRGEDAEQARPVLDLLVAAADAADREEGSPDGDVFLAARRRHAQCLMRLKERHGAKAALGKLLERKLDGRTRALVHTDLGLLAGGFSTIWEVQLPVAQGDLKGVVEKLALGEKRFREALRDDDDAACGGQYCLGVLSLGRAALDESGYQDAAPHFRQARSIFLNRRDRYSRIVPATDIYYGVASIRSLSRAGLAQGPEILVEGMRAGAALPSYLVAPVVEAMEFADQAGQQLVYDAIVEAGDDGTLDVVATSKSVLQQCPAAVRALQARGGKADRPGHLAASDLRAALLGHVVAGDRDAAADVLSDLEAMAQRGVGAQEFAELLTDPSRYEPAWSQEDAAIALAHCHEAQGQFLDATRLLREYFYQYASRGTEHWLDEAEGILRKVEEYGIDPSIYKDMQDRYAALAAASGLGEVDPDQAERPEVKVLVVGGNEVQARAEDQVRAKLHRTHPHVRVEFIRSGWGSNWQKPLEEFNRKLPVFDAVVIMRFMRTELGRRIRKACTSHPWRSCWSPGQMAQVTAVIKAAEATSPKRRPGS